MQHYAWKYFPGRLHSTKEIIFFLENIDNIADIIDSYPYEIVCCIFGDIINPGVISDTKIFLNTKVEKTINKIILEISARNVFYYNNIPLNTFYVKNCRKVRKRNDLKYVELSDIEIENDLKYIVQLSKQIFNVNVEIHVIPHLNLKTKQTNDYIYIRNKFTTLLERVCHRDNIHFHNIGRFIEENSKETIFIETFMPDSSHYEYGYDSIKSYLKERIYGGR